MTFAEKVLSYHKSLTPDWPIPEGVDLLYPYTNPDTWAVMEGFYNKFYLDHQPRTFLFGINPGRFGAGITGVPFTDPIRLEKECGIKNPFHKRQELSSVFVYEVINAFGGVEAFCKKNYITSLSPLGFTRDGKNLNYYDDKELMKATRDFIVENIHAQIEFGCNRKAAICLGQGKNFKFFEKLNGEYRWFKEVIPLPHPRWVMQYRRKKMKAFVDLYVRTLIQEVGS